MPEAGRALRTVTRSHNISKCAVRTNRVANTACGNLPAKILDYRILHVVSNDPLAHLDVGTATTGQSVVGPFSQISIQ